MFRNLILILAVAAFVWIARALLSRSRLQHQKPPPGTAKDMVQCEQCKTYLPKDEAIIRDGRAFCGQQHLQDWKQNH